MLQSEAEALTTLDLLEAETLTALDLLEMVRLVELEAEQLEALMLDNLLEALMLDNLLEEAMLEDNRLDRPPEALMQDLALLLPQLPEDHRSVTEAQQPSNREVPHQFLEDLHLLTVKSLPYLSRPKVVK